MKYGDNAMMLTEAQEKRLRDIVRYARTLKASLAFAYRVDGIESMLITGGGGKPLRVWQSFNPYGRAVPRANVFPVATIYGTDSAAYARLAEVAQEILDREAH